MANPNDESVSSDKNPIDKGKQPDSRTKQGNDPSQGVNAGEPWDRNTSNPVNPVADDGKGLHPAVDTDDKVKSSGRHVGGLPNEPLITVHAVSGKKSKQSSKRAEHKVMHDVGEKLLDEQAVAQYDVSELEIGSGLFIAVEQNQTIDQAMSKANKAVHKLNDYWSVFALNDEGERILDVVMIEELKRNDDKSIQLDMDSKPIVGANQTFIPRKIQIRQYVAKAVTADDDKFDDDGALIVRVF